MAESHVLYRFYSATGQLLYVGITMNPPQRFKSHRDSKEWWGEVSGITVENYPNREDLALAERRAIQVEHPMYNIVHAKGSRPKSRPTPSACPERAPAPEVAEEIPVRPEIAALFAPKPPVDIFAMFKSDRIDTEFGWLTPEQYEKRIAEHRAKWQARKDCPLCDSSGYRNGYLCDHVDHSGEPSRFESARRRALKERLRVVPGGGA